MKHLTPRRIAGICGGTLSGKQKGLDQEITAITTDSRKVTCGCLFVAIKGVRVDGHDFIEQVIRDGAAAVLGENEIEDTGVPYIRVPSSLQAVKQIAGDYLKQLNIPVVGITGSVGKTSTKEMIASVLAQRYRVLKTDGNFNNELGLPLTVFRLRDEHEIAVLEMGISDFGEMHRLAEVARPETCVITNIGTCHLENLGDRDGVLRAKTEIFDFLKPDGHIVLCGDDDKLSTVSRKEDTMRFGFGPGCDVTADSLTPAGLLGTKCIVHTPKGSFHVRVPKPGTHMVMDALAAAAVGLIYGLDTDQIRTGIETCESIAGRFHVISTGSCTIIDDCYNANPMSMKASLEVLQQCDGRRVAILGDMGELGPEEKELHAEVGRKAASLAIDAVYCAGPLSEYLAEAAAGENPDLEVRHFKDREALEAAVPKLIRTGDVVLVKASHFMQYENVVKKLQTET